MPTKKTSSQMIPAGRGYSPRKAVTDDAFMAWATSLKPCRYCEELFVGPVCACERKGTSA